MEISSVPCHLRAQILSVGLLCACYVSQQRASAFSLSVLPIIWFCVQCIDKRQFFYTSPSIQMELSLPFSWVAEVA